MAAQYVRLPPRAQQSTDRLMRADEQPAMERRRIGDPSVPPLPGATEHPMLAFVAEQSLAARAIAEHTGQPLSDMQRMFGDPASSEVILLLASKHLHNDALSTANLVQTYQAEEMRKRHRSKTDRIAESADGAAIVRPATRTPSMAKACILTGMGLLGQANKGDTVARSIDDFFANDHFATAPLPPLLAHSEVRRWPQVQEVLANFRDKSRDSGQRRWRLEFAAELTPRINMPTLTKQERWEWFMPPRDGIDRLCVMDVRCRCRIGESQSIHAYIGREFVLPGWKRPKNVGPCLHCTDYGVKCTFVIFQKLQHPPEAAIHLYQVPLDVTTGYNQRDDMLPVEQDRRATGVIAPYPNYRESRYDYRPIPDEMARRHGFADKPGAPTHYKTEIGLDFH